MMTGVGNGNLDSNKAMPTLGGVTAKSQPVLAAVQKPTQQGPVQQKALSIHATSKDLFQQITNTSKPKSEEVSAAPVADTVSSLKKAARRDKAIAFAQTLLLTALIALEVFFFIAAIGNPGMFLGALAIHAIVAIMTQKILEKSGLDKEELKQVQSLTIIPFAPLVVPYQLYKHKSEVAAMQEFLVSGRGENLTSGKTIKFMREVTEETVQDIRANYHQIHETISTQIQEYKKQLNKQADLSQTQFDIIEQDLNMYEHALEDLDKINQEIQRRDAQGASALPPKPVLNQHMITPYDII